ncbi:MAG: hypothetical protein ACKVWV_13970 [Planctomycetota bacterium]
MGVTTCFVLSVMAAVATAAAIDGAWFPVFALAAVAGFESLWSP